MENRFNISGVWQSISDFWFYIALTAVGIMVAIILIRCLAKKKWAGVIVTAIITALLVGGGFVYRLPHKIIDISQNDISKIVVSNVEVTDSETIEAIFDDLNQAEYKRTLPSCIGGRQEYSVQVYDQTGALRLSLGIADEYMVNTGIFWEELENSKLDISLYQRIAEGMAEK